jgi:hypothetical protein
MKASEVKVPVTYSLEYEERPLIYTDYTCSSGTNREQEMTKTNGHELGPGNLEISTPVCYSDMQEIQASESEAAALLTGVSSSSCKNKALERDSGSDSSVSGRICRYVKQHAYKSLSLV